MDLTTKDNVKKLLNITNDTTNDVLLISIVKATSAAIEEYLDRLLETKERTQYFDVEPGQQVFNLNAYPIVSCKAYNDPYRRSDVEINSDTYTFLGECGQLIIDRFDCYAGAKALKVVYTGGLASDQAHLEALYPDIEMAARIQSAFLFESKNQLFVISESVDRHTVSQREKLQLHAYVKEILSQYVRNVNV